MAKSKSGVKRNQMAVGRRSADEDVNRRIAVAEGLLAAGASPETVRKSLGVYIGADGAPRLEISDHEARIRDLEAETLGEFMEHPEFFAHYPQLAEVPVRGFSADEERENLMGYVKPDPEGGLPEFGLRTDLPEEDLLDTLIHEGQHLVQDVEGWASGGSVGSGNSLGIGFDRLDRSQDRQKELADLTSKYLDRETGNKDFDAFYEALADIDRRRNRESAAYDFASSYYGQRKDRGSERAGSDFWDELESLHDEYEDIGGEREARDTADRRTLTPESRSGIAPLYSEQAMRPDLQIADPAYPPFMDYYFAVRDRR